MMVVYKKPDGGAVVLVKGAPEMVLNVCTSVHSKKSGKTSNLNEKRIKKLDKANADMGSKGLRVLGLAYRELSSVELSTLSVEEMESNLTLISLVGMFFI